MCGLVGLVSASGSLLPGDADHIALSMADAIKFRGPDSLAAWTNQERTVAFGHARLAIIDLSEAGNQPMHSPSRRYTIVFNGEIYNHQALRKTLGGDALDWRGHSDTEVLLAAIDHWGLEATLPLLEGMFAFALYDNAAQKLFLARDRIGEKPIYFGWVGDHFVFSSQVSAFHRHPQWSLDVDRDAVAYLLRYGFIPAPRCIYSDVRKLGAGCVLSLDVPARARAFPQPHRYWAPLTARARIQEQGIASSDQDSVAKLETLLKGVIRDELVADVPVGMFLSGGIDSSLIAALMQAETGNRVRTFTIGFQEAAYDEAEHARRIAEHIGTDHCQLYLTAADALATIGELPRIYDEPFADASQIPTYLLTRLARREVAVALSGDGGDEMFGGYTRHVWADVLFAASRVAPAILRRQVSGLLARLPPRVIDGLYQSAEQFLPLHLRQTAITHKFAKLNAFLNSSSTQDIYCSLLSHWAESAKAVIGSAPGTGVLDEYADVGHGMAPAERVMFDDVQHYLPDDILVKVDRAAMFCSLETRAPYLHPHVVEFSGNLPLSRKLRNRKGKWILRELLSKYVPKPLFERPKQGFGLPIRDWLRGPLRDWAEALLDPVRIRREGFLLPDPIVSKWREHVSGLRNWEYQLWSVLMFQQWLGATRQR